MADGSRDNTGDAKARLFALLSSHEFEAADDDYWAPVEPEKAPKPEPGPRREVPTYFAAASFEEFSAHAVESFRFEPDDSVSKLYPDQLRNWSARRPSAD